MNSHRDDTEIRPPAPRDPDLPQRVIPFIAGAWPLAILLLLATLPYVGILRHDFTYAYDDKAQILDNPYVHSFGHLREALTTSVWSFKSGYGVSNYYRPVMTIGFLLCYHIFGPLAYGFHLASLLLHAAVVTMLFLFAERLFRDRGAAFGAAFLFALHPIHVEPVAWICAVSDMEMTFFYVLTFWCFLQVGEQRGGRRIRTQAAMTASFLLALCSKEPALTLPWLAAVYEYFYREDRAEVTRVGKFLRQGPLWLVFLGYFLMRAWLFGAVAHNTGLHHLTPLETVLSALTLTGQYLTKLLWPAHLSAFYVFQASTRLFQAPVLAGVGALALCAMVFVALWKRARPASFGILWLLATLGPVLNARWMAAYVLAERDLYLPSVGFCLVGGWAGAALWRAAARRQIVWRVATVAAAFFLSALCVLGIVTRVPDWQDDVTLFAEALVAEPHDYRLHDALGVAYWIRGEAEGAEREWQETLHLEPNSIQTLDSLGALYAQQHRFDQAMPLLEKAIRLNPKDGDAHLSLGAAYAETGKMDRAEEHFRAAVLLSPLNFNAHNLLGKLYFDSKRLTEAEPQFRQSLQCEPNLAAYDHLGYIYVQWGDPGRAERAFKAALAMNRTDSHAHCNLGLIYAATGRTAQAREELQLALKADPNNPEILSALEKLRR
jgi:Flp pilus assembly protein TadD